MRYILFLLFSCFCLGACSSVMPYKDQNLDYLYSIQKDFAAYKGAVVAFNGEVAGVRETTQNMRIILRIDTPLYYYATGKGNNLSYEMIYVRFTKDVPRPTAIIQGHKLKVLGRVDGYEKRQDTYTGKTLGVVRLDAIALADRTTGKDFIRQDAPSNALYQSWKAGKLFFEESAESVLRAFPPAPTPEPKPKAVKPVKKTPKKETPKPAVIPPSAGIVFDEEEPPFILPPDPQTPETPQAPNAAEPTAPAPESQPGNAALMNNPAEGKETEEKTTPSTSANEQAGKAALNKTTGEQTADNATPGKTAIEQTAEQAAPSKANEEQTGENSAPKADKEKAGQPDLNKADEKQTEKPTVPGKATGEQAAEQADLNKADKKQPEEKAVNAAAQKSAAPQTAAQTPLQAPAAPQTGAQKSAAPQTAAGAQSTQGTEPPAAPEKATPAPENTRPQ
ncbi:hypothetical protein [Candidatus Avelusimicrobium faecicola]|uniref:hypothetical protein n=1 Tax=Candidatus Avelusimicrobium faecicola TaxID=3416205 RepID=UPI003D142EE6